PLSLHDALPISVLLARKRVNRRFTAAAVIALLLTAGFGLWVTYGFGGITVAERIDDLGEAVAALVAAVACGAAALRHVGRSRLGWLLISASALTWSMGELVWSYYELGLGRQVPFPSIADAGFLGAVPLAAAGIALFAPARRRAVIRMATVLDGLIIAGSLLAVSWTTILETIYSHGADSVVAQGISLAYPVSDVVILTMLFLPYIPMAIAVLASCADAVITGSIDAFLFYDIVIVVMLVVIRQFMMFFDNTSLNERLQEQAAALQRREEHLRSLVEHSSDAA